MNGFIMSLKNLYLEDFESLLVILGDFVHSDQLSVIAIAWVSHDVVLHRENSLCERNFDRDGTIVRNHMNININTDSFYSFVLTLSGSGIAHGLKCREVRSLLTQSYPHSNLHPLQHTDAHMTECLSPTVHHSWLISGWSCLAPWTPLAISGPRSYV